MNHFDSISYSIEDGFRTAVNNEENPLSEKEYKAVMYYVKNGVMYAKKVRQQVCV